MAPDSRPAEVFETHVSTIFLVGDHAYKLKKPVDLGFLDFTTREARAEACHQEVRLNRRLAPDVYLDVADIVAGNGEVTDHLVVMRRMPTERRLDRLVVSRQGQVRREVKQVARTIAAFHAGLAPILGIGEPVEQASQGGAAEIAGSRLAVLLNWEDCLEQLRPFAGGILDAARLDDVQTLARRYLAGRESLFEQRQRDGFVRDGHGDLRADNIFCLPDGPRILDCVEFDDRFRHGDVLADIAFLAMDLERLGAGDMSSALMTKYGEFSGETHPLTLAEHYLAYRACVRAKVACLRHAQGDHRAADEANQLLDICVRHLERGRVCLVLVGGAPGTGKSTLATGLADRRQWSLLRSDQVRKELAREPSVARDGSRLYGSEMTQSTYKELLRRAGHALRLGQPVVLDASWQDRRWRMAAAELAEQGFADLVELRCQAPLELAMARASARQRSGADASDAGPEIAQAVAADFAGWPSATTIYTTVSETEVLEVALAELPT
jgi:aminoglycoside phosphotransferase family enzyme/predicted kinase